MMARDNYLGIMLLASPVVCEKPCVVDFDVIQMFELVNEVPLSLKELANGVYVRLKVLPVEQTKAVFRWVKPVRDE